MKEHQTRTMVIIVASAYVAMFLLMFIFATKENKEQFLSYSLCGLNFVLALSAVWIYHTDLITDVRSRGWKKFTLQVLLSSIVAVGTNFVGYTIYLNIAKRASSNQEVLDSVQYVAPLALIITSIVLAPIVEETIFRHVIQKWLKSKCGAAIAIAITSILFALVHGGFSFDIFPYLLAGIALGIIYEKTGSYAVVVCAHMVNNLVSQLVS